ncbi:DUF365 domain-containing protein [Ferroglobus placidus]
MKFVFYQSREDQGFVREAKIRDIKLVYNSMKASRIFK